MPRDFRKYWFIRLLLFPISVLYGIITDFRNFFYTHRLFKVSDFDVPIISIGNIVAGGTGKSPLTMLCIDLLKDQKKQIVVVSRGYGRASSGLKVVSDGTGHILPASEGGDEPVMIAMRYPHVPVIVSEDRVVGIEQAKKIFNPDLVLLDDAFQHRAVSRHCDLVIMNSSRNLKAERMLPLGDLRERLINLNRADILVLNNSLGTLSERDMRLLKQLYEGPIYECKFFPTALVNASFEKSADLSALKDAKVYAFSAIAGPEKFIKTLSDLGAKVQKARSYPDHYSFRQSDYKQIRDEYQALKCQYLVTTEKDMVKIDKDELADVDTLALSLSGEIKNIKSFLDKVNQFVDIKF